MQSSQMYSPRRHDSGQRTPSLPQGQQKRLNRNRKPQGNTTGMPHLDGAVSDSSAVPESSPRSRKAVRQPNAPVNAQQSHYGQQNTKKHNRPVSMVGTGALETPAKEQAYAGPTFQASPAPSSLPVPKFFSRSVPNANVAGSLQARLASEQAVEKESSPESDFVSPERPPGEFQQSPLDMFFKADKAEKEQRKSSSQLLSPRATPPFPGVQRNPASTGSASSRRIFMQELDGQNDDEDARGLHRPHAQARQSFRGSYPVVKPSGETAAPDKREEYTQSLKDMLFKRSDKATVSTEGCGDWPNPQPRPHAQFETPSPQRSSANESLTPFSEQRQDQYPLHYGNRDLSPLFVASRRDGAVHTQPALHHQAAQSPSQDSAQRSGLYSSPARTHHGDYKRSHSDDTSGFLSPNQSVPLSDGLHERSSHQDRGSTISPPMSNVRDIGAMENDLRRLLKLNAIT